MWRLCDLHTHTRSDAQEAAEWSAASFVDAQLARGLDVVAVTDHDEIQHVDEVLEAAAGTALHVVAGVELSTDRGHLLVLSPNAHGLACLRNFLTRVGAAPATQVAVDTVLEAAKDRQPGGVAYAEELIFIGAHVDKAGSMLAASQTWSLERQLALASRMHALEVSEDSVLAEWSRTGVKQGAHMTLLRNSDSHGVDTARNRATWIYLPAIDARSIQHALALPESSVSLDSDRPETAQFAIESIAVEGGHHDGLRLELRERANAIIGPPNSGKSLIVDLLKFAFGITSDITEVEQVSRARMLRCLPSGSVVEVRVKAPSGSVTLRRVVGSGDPPDSPFRPIVFSQTELTRRAIALTPAISLLDLHVPAAASLHAEVVESARLVRESFKGLLDESDGVKSLRASVTNAVDGLAATRAELQELAGAQDLAAIAAAVAGVEAWRTTALAQLIAWRTNPPAPVPALATPSDLDEGLEEYQVFMPIDRIKERLRRLKADVEVVIASASADMEAMLTSQETEFAETKERMERELLEAGFEPGSDLESRLTQLRSRLTALEAKEARLRQVDSSIDAGLAALKILHDSAATAHSNLTAARREACRAVNKSMRTFFAKLAETPNSASVDVLVEELAVGTYMRLESRRELRNTLDRFRLLESAVRLRQGLEPAERGSLQEQLVASVGQRRREIELAGLACLWPEDVLELAQRDKSPVQFNALTEGLRALAIKEISFAASQLPVITDQPEDAVPTRAVFDSLVPTLREQRRQRQFIVVSHDANIVVASDVERIVVLQANEDGSSHAGNLFDSRIRAAALEHLEGGSRAFQLRADRYSSLGPSDA